LNRRTESWVIGALFATAAVAFVVLLGALFVGATESNNEPSTRSALVVATANPFATKAPTPVTLHYTYTPVPSPTPVGHLCSQDQLSINHDGDNGGGGAGFVYLRVVDVGGEPCDLPALVGVDAYDNTGALINSSGVTPWTNCDAAVIFCVAPSTIPLNPVTTTPFLSFASGGNALVTVEFETWCLSKTGQCPSLHFGSVSLRFEGQISLSIDLSDEYPVVQPGTVRIAGYRSFPDPLR
jgi:hypothetical protein